MHDFQAQYLIRTTAEQVTQPITSPHYSLLILEGLNKRKKSKVYLHLFQGVQYFRHNKKLEMKGKLLSNLLLLFLVAISIDCAICLIPRTDYSNTAAIAHVVCSSNTFDFTASILGVLAKKKMQYLLKEKVFFVFRVSHPIAPLAFCPVIQRSKFV